MMSPQQHEAGASGALALSIDGLPVEIQGLVMAAICKPHAACTTEQLKNALKAFKTVSETNRLLCQLAQPLLHATFLRLFGLGPIKPGWLFRLLAQDLPKVLKGIVASPLPLRGLQCLSDLVNGSMSERSEGAKLAFDRWIILITQHRWTYLTTQHDSIIDDGDSAVPYHTIPALLAVRLGQMMRPESEPRTDTLMLMKRLVRATKALPNRLAMPVLTEAALLALVREIGFGTLYTAPPPLGGGVRLVAFGSDEVFEAMAERGAYSTDTEQSLCAVAQVLALELSPQMSVDAETVQDALMFLVNCPSLLIGSMAQALDIIERLETRSSFADELLARCVSKRASLGLL